MTSTVLRQNDLSRPVEAIQLKKDLVPCEIRALRSDGVQIATRTVLHDLEQARTKILIGGHSAMPSFGALLSFGFASTMPW